MQLLDAIKQRKTVKLFDRSYRLSRETLEELLQLAQLAPSKANLQPWRCLILDNEESKSKLKGKIAFNEPPCDSASAVILVLADLQYDKLLGDIIDHSIASGCLGAQFRENSYNFLLSNHQSLSAQEIRDQVLIDSSLMSMQLMLAAKEKGLDTHAIGIFDKHAVLQAFDIDPERYAPVMLIAIGKAAVPPLPSVRLPLDYTCSWNMAAFKK